MRNNLKDDGSESEHSLSIEETILHDIAEALLDNPGSYNPEVVAVTCAHLSATPGRQWSPTWISNVTGIAPGRVRGIMAGDDFKACTKEALQGVNTKQVAIIHKVLFMKALTGSPLHIKLFLDRFDKEAKEEETALNPTKLIEFLKVRAKLDQKQVAALISGRAVVTVPEAIE